MKYFIRIECTMQSEDQADFDDASLVVPVEAKGATEALHKLADAIQALAAKSAHHHRDVDFTEAEERGQCNAYGEGNVRCPKPLGHTDPRGHDFRAGPTRIELIRALTDIVVAYDNQCARSAPGRGLSAHSPDVVRIAAARKILARVKT